MQSRHGRDAAGHAIEQAFASLASDLSDTACAGSSSRGARLQGRWWTGSERAFAVGPEIAPGVPVIRTVGMKNREMGLALKSGNFGGPQFFPMRSP